MSINWVMVSPTSKTPFTPLPNEQTLHTSPPRISLSISTPPAHFPGRQAPPPTPFSLTHSSGVLHLTNRRLIYLPDRATDRLQSFAAPLLNLHDSHVTAPFFGPNVWIAACQPVAGGGLPASGAGVLEVKMTFKDGGAFDFQAAYERTRERLQQAVEHARETGGEGGPRIGGGGGGTAAVNPASVTLDDLPAYREVSDGPLIAPTAATFAAAAAVTHSATNGDDGGRRDEARSQPGGSGFAPPAEPPPGYEP